VLRIRVTPVDAANAKLDAANAKLVATNTKLVAANAKLVTANAKLVAADAISCCVAPNAPPWRQNALPINA
jgi:cell division protein FtsB